MPLPTTLEAATAADVKAYFNYNDTNRDGVLAVVLPMTIDLIYNYCRHDFKSVSRTFQPLIEPVQDVFYVPRYPIDPTTPPVVVENGNTLVKDTDWTCEYEIGRFKRLTAPRDGYYDRIYNYGLYWSTQPHGITATYVGGHVLTGDVYLAFCELAGIYSQINQKVYTDITGAEQAVRYDAIPEEIRKILDRHILSRAI
jgi:hypothetical protein